MSIEFVPDLVQTVTDECGLRIGSPLGLFNAGLEGNTHRAIDFRESDKINEKALKALIRAAVALNESEPLKGKARRKGAGTR